ncbi:MAG: sigma-70 family RNA polymerase sigma factor [Rhodanobacteraceae bacterium]|nr:sigma-70 family RNA polymerase sigma factor [Xanthomonadales bacterium]MCP5477239.1 sigma-70 family RNA polymerase sigma factor [Rhodanobacteraceae bacterium]HPF74466.1 sigma-70 family RNA polymerase sigma factor [Xanthomonadaceae bacterium]HRY00815.1 sigma-70 family RNA polymerase sigma factor [Xanthomonadaceae bacterium]
MTEQPHPPKETQYPLDAHMAELYPVVQRLAAAQLRQYAGMTLEPGDLVSQLYIKLQQSEPDRRIGRTHFVSLAVRVIRQLIADHARGRSRQKRGGDQAPLTMTLSGISDEQGSVTRIARFDECLERLERMDAAAAEVVGLKVFGGLSGEEIAEAMGIGSATVTRKWAMARAWLGNELAA